MSAVGGRSGPSLPTVRLKCVLAGGRGGGWAKEGRLVFCLERFEVGSLVKPFDYAIPYVARRCAYGGGEVGGALAPCVWLPAGVLPSVTA